MDHSIGFAAQVASCLDSLPNISVTCIQFPRTGLSRAAYSIMDNDYHEGDHRGFETLAGSGSGSCCREAALEIVAAETGCWERTEARAESGPLDCCPCITLMAHNNIVVAFSTACFGHHSRLVPYLARCLLMVPPRAGLGGYTDMYCDGPVSGRRSGEGSESLIHLRARS